MHLQLKYQQNNISICLQVGNSMEGWSCERHVHKIQYQFEAKLMGYNKGK